VKMTLNEISSESAGLCLVMLGFSWSSFVVTQCSGCPCSR